MSAEVYSRAGAFVLLAAVAGALGAPAAAFAQGAPASFKVAWYNIQSGKGEPGMPGHLVRFSDTANCTDSTQPMNAWAIGFVQQHLISSVGNDPKVVALGLAESWGSVCGSPENVRQVLGWKSRTSERNGVAMVAKYGFAGPEQWLQLDTTLNTNLADTMWVLRMPVCLDAACTQSIPVFASHWYGSGANTTASYDRQAIQTAAFLQSSGGTAPHILIADLNVWEGSAKACSENPKNVGLPRLRAAGYSDAWLLIHGSAEGFTGMTNRSGCGYLGEGYAWKRPDYTWSPAGFLPISIERFGIVPAGDEAPSDHYGLITEFPWPGAPPPPVDTVRPTVTLLTPVEGLNISGGSLSISTAATDDVGVTRVEILEDGVVAHSLVGQSAVSCSHLTSTAGTHTVAARAFDAAGNAGTSEVRHVLVAVTPPPVPSATGEIVLYAKNASVVAGAWQIVADPQAAGGARLWNPDAAVAKLPAALAAPANYFELTFNVESGRAYRLWMRGRADNDAWTNDSVYAQFSGSVTATGAPVSQIGTTGATWVGIEDCSGCGLSGWGWQDNGYGTGVLGPLVYFAATGPQTIRIQQREDGISLDQIVLSPVLYLTAAPGVTKQDTVVLPVTSVAPTPAPVSATEIVVTAGTATAVAGTWRLIADTTAANGTAIGTVNVGLAKITTALVAPVDYAELTFQAEAGRAYRLWIRGRAEEDSWANDSAFVQFSGSLDAAGNAVARIGSTSSYVVNLEDASNAGVAGWGWQDNGYGAGVLGPLVKFGVTGPQTLRVQTREDGFRIDQIVLSAETSLTSAPGPLKNDATILR
jgi:Big-like domain-containing protein